MNEETRNNGREHFKRFGEKRLQWFGHVKRRDRKRLPRKA